MDHVVRVHVLRRHRQRKRARPVRLMLDAEIYKLGERMAHRILPSGRAELGRDDFGGAAGAAFGRTVPPRRERELCDLPDIVDGVLGGVVLDLHDVRQKSEPPVVRLHLLLKH